MTHSTIVLLIDALACFRLTHLIIDDAIFAPVRDRLIGNAYGETRDLAGHRPRIAARPRVAAFLTCPWCVSFWLGLLVVVLQVLIPAAWFYAAVTLALSAFAGLLSEIR